MFLARYDRDMRSSLLKSMTSRKEFDSASLHSEEGNQFAHVFYRHRKAFTDYLPLLTSYAIFTVITSTLLLSNDDCLLEIGMIVFTDVADPHAR